MTAEPSGVQPGDVVSGLEPSMLVEVVRVAAFGKRTLVEGVGVDSQRLIRRPLSPSELARLERVRSSSMTFDGDAESFLRPRGPARRVVNEIRGAFSESVGRPDLALASEAGGGRAT